MQEVTIGIAGAAGDGLDKSGDTLAKICGRLGLHVYAYNSYQSIIRGGHIWLRLRIGDQKVHNHGDKLTALLEEVLRRWPLSGVLADIDEAPLTPLTFGGHPGLLMLYAERLAQHEKPAWIPSGAAMEYVELVYADLGKDCPEPKEGP